MAKTIKASEVRALIAENKTRKEIAEHFGVSQEEMKRKVWSHPAFKNKKLSLQPAVFIDDEAGVQTEASAETTEDAATETATTQDAPASEGVTGPGNDVDAADNADTEQRSWS